jgi:hypothetical protein
MLLYIFGNITPFVKNIKCWGKSGFPQRGGEGEWVLHLGIARLVENCHMIQQCLYNGSPEHLKLSSPTHTLEPLATGNSLFC